jgi:hypothetical protein
MAGNDRAGVPQTTSRVVLTPAQQRTRRRFEALIGVAAPFLDLVLAVGDRISRAAEPEDYEYYPVRAGELAEEPSARGRRPRPTGD